MDLKRITERLARLREREQQTGESKRMTMSMADAMPAALAAIPEERIVQVDVREELRAGREPFARIMAAVGEVAADGALSLRAIFEPAPLYGVLRRQGFAHFTQMHAEDDWQVWFYREPAVATAPAVAPDAAQCADDTHVLDVRGMEPPDPMVKTLEVLQSLPAGATLVQINTRVPQFLLPMLQERGYTWEIREQSADLVRIFIRKAETAMDRTLDVRVIPPREKHPAIFQTFAELKPGESFVLVNDHDPRPLRYQFEAEHNGEFGWTYLEQGPAVWRVEISRTVR